MNKTIKHLLQGIHDKYGYDFFNYKTTSIEKNIKKFLIQEHLNTIDELYEKVMTDKEFFLRLIGRLTISVSSMFRDAYTFKFLREHVIPILETYPYIRIWSAGAGTGEEAYSLAILLKEENLYHRSLIYATDINPVVLDKAYKGRYPLGRVSEFTKNYIDAGGKESFSKYYTTTSRYAQIIPELKQNIVFTTHNLIQDAMFNEFQLILCRNILIYFNKVLQNKVLKLFNQSLSERGFLYLGTSENIKYCEASRYFETINDHAKIFRKY